MRQLAKNVINERAEKLSQATFLLALALENKENYFTKLFSLTQAEFRCLRFLNCKCSYTVKDLSIMMGLSPSRITQLITALELKKYVSRKIDPNDRRNIQIKLTKFAHPFIDNVINKYVELHANVLETIPDESQDSILLALNELLNLLENWSNQTTKKLT